MLCVIDLNFCLFSCSCRLKVLILVVKRFQLFSSIHVNMYKCVLPFFPDPAYVLDTRVVVGIAFAAFVIGALLTGALWFIYSHTGRFSTCSSLIPSQTWLLWKAKMQRNVLPAGVAKHPAAKRHCFQITYWVFYCKYILLVSSKSSSLSCLWMFWRLWGGQQIFSVQWLETSWKFPLLSLAVFTGKDTQSLH